MRLLTLSLAGLLTLGTAARAQTAGSVGIGTTTPDASALLELSTTTKGLLLPRLTQTQRTAIQNPAPGLLIYQTDETPGLYLYGGSSWSLLPNTTQTTGDNLGNHTATQNLNLADKVLVGQNSTTDAVGTSGLRVYSDGQVGVGTLRTLDSYNNTSYAGLEVHSNHGLLATGNFVGNTAADPPQEGSGARLLWYPAKAAFRAGYVNGTQWDGANIGLYSVAIGYNNRASGDYGVALGNGSSAAQTSSVAIGEGNVATGYTSVALGYYAHTGARRGSFVFADNSVTGAVYDANTGLTTYNYLTATTTNTFNARFVNGYFLYTNTGLTTGVKVAAGGNAWETVSDSTRKEHVRLADGAAFLQKISRMRLGSWNYKGQSTDTMRHYGPMAQDFYAAFGHDGVGRVGNPTSINQADFDGVNLIAIQALIREVEALKAANLRLEAANRHLHAQAQASTAALESRLRALESLLSPQADAKQPTLSH
ncbi:hypothetical protein FY528_06835 [Hymenobacter lutimineralis]|uniref:Peptidase S74 domain-containing protein n=1 Tax=Hymenobacter lutimineralis TaxID=2606448 RepID=A0A5D6V868_9BACT|nr:tail fiber domain-containing protein [Hymenobacter lutimineralis]TYZ11405.1 hypothetical protein FY528_06835 [Hymenobacter lutimineralis]